MTKETQNDASTDATEGEAAAIDEATQADESAGEDSATDSDDTSEEGE